MLEGSIADLTKIAADSSTPSHLLLELGKHKNYQIRSLVASNPNTPLETLKSLGGFANAIVANPVFDLLQLENPNSKFIRLTLAISDKTPPESLTQLTATKDFDDACYALGSNASTPLNTLADIAIAIVSNKNVVDPPFRVVINGSVFNWLGLVQNIISRPDIPESSLEKIMDITIERDLFQLLWKWIKIPDLSFSMLEKLSKYPEKHPDKRIEGFDELLIDFPTVKESPILLDNIARNIGNIDLRHKKDVFLEIANNPLTLSSTIEYLAAYLFHSPQIRNALANHPNVSRKALDIFLLTQLKPGTPIEVLHEVAGNPRFYSSVLICLYPNVPSEVINKIGDNLPSYGKDAGYRLRVFQYLAYHPNSSSNLLQKILDELQQVSSSVTNGKKHYQGKFIDDKFLREIDKLVEIINRRLDGEHLAETDKLCAYWSLYEPQTDESYEKIAKKLGALKQGRYVWAGFYLPDPKSNN